MVEPLTAKSTEHKFFSWKGRIACLISAITVTATLPFEAVYRVFNVALKIALFIQGCAYFLFQWESKHDLRDRFVHVVDTIALLLLTPLNTLVTIERCVLGAIIHPGLVYNRNNKLMFVSGKLQE